MSDIGMTQARSRQIGRAIMAVAGLKLVFGLRLSGRAPLLLKLPLAAITLAASGVLFWIGVTMTVKDWDDPADWPPAGETSSN